MGLTLRGLEERLDGIEERLEALENGEIKKTMNWGGATGKDYDICLEGQFFCESPRCCDEDNMNAIFEMNYDAPVDGYPLLCAECYLGLLKERGY